jgi:hypothetical protein
LRLGLGWTASQGSDFKGPIVAQDCTEKGIFYLIEIFAEPEDAAVSI